MKKNLSLFQVVTLVQDKDNDEITKEDMKVVTHAVPTDDQWDAMLLLESHSFRKSNAVILSNSKQTVGIGAGQMNRVGAARLL